MGGWFIHHLSLIEVLKQATSNAEMKVHSTGEIGLFTFRAPVNSLQQRLLFCKCQILMAKDTTCKLSPQILGLRNVDLRPQNKSICTMTQQITKMQQLPFRTCKLLRGMKWNAKNNAGSLCLAICVCAASKCNNCWVPTNQQPPCWVMEAFKGPAAARRRLKWDNNDFFRAGCRTPPPAAWAIQVFVERKLISAAIRWWKTWLPTLRPALTNTAADADQIWLPGLSFRLCCWLSHPAHPGLFLARQWVDVPERREPDRRTLLHRTCTPGTESASIQ